MITKGEVQSNDVHAGVEHLTHGLWVIAARSKRSDNTRLTLIQIDLLKDVLETNAR